MAATQTCPWCKRNVPVEINGLHRNFCRKSRGGNESMVCCEFNASHVIPLTERELHAKTCVDRRLIPPTMINERAAADGLRAIANEGVDQQTNGIKTTTVQSIERSKDVKKSTVYVATFNSFPQGQMSRIRDSKQRPYFFK